MKRAFLLMILFFSVLSFALITADPFIHSDIKTTFPGEIRFLTYNDRPAFAVDISFYPDTIFLSRNIKLPEIELLILKLDDSGDIVESTIGPAAYNSRLLNKVFTVAGETIVPYTRKEGYKIPDTIAGFELDSKKTETGSLLYYLPEEWNLIWKLQWGNDSTKIFGDNKYIDIYPYSGNAIKDVFLANAIMFPNLEKLYDVYKYISTFEDMNNSLKNVW